MSLVAAPFILLACGLAALAAGRSFRLSTTLGVLGPVAAAVVGCTQAVGVLLDGQTLRLDLPWSLPVGRFLLSMDNLSAWFALPVLVLGAVAAIYGIGYMRSHAGKRNLGPHWFFYNVLAAGMLMVLLARDGVLFLMAWEVMSLASFFLVMFDSHSGGAGVAPAGAGANEGEMPTPSVGPRVRTNALRVDSQEESVRQAGWTYLVATHIGTAFLFVMFMLLGGQGTAFSDMKRSVEALPHLHNVLFILAVVGFGTKAGFMPLHVWLPEAHPAAPSHVSAVMSGVMIKTGIYGLLRMLAMLGTPPAWWGWTLLIVGAVSGVMGILMSLTQHDVKRMLAYSSVENVGIITMGIGLGLIGASTHQPALTLLGFGGALLHVVNHAMFKGLLFLAAGSVLHGAGTRMMDLLGGLGRQMRWTSAMFALGAVAICGLPPLNGFMGEFLLYIGCYGGVLGGGSVAASLVAIGALALIGGLALASFTRAFGIIFLGQGRSKHARNVHEASFSMKLAMGVLGAACVSLAVAAPLLVNRAPDHLAPFWPLGDGPHCPACLDGDILGPAGEVLAMVLVVSAIFLVLFVLLAALRGGLLRGRAVEQAGTWDCGYAAPDARIQYTASSFAQPITNLMRIFHRGRTIMNKPLGLFPSEGSLETRTPDLFTVNVFRPIFAGVAWVVAKLRWLQQGRIQLYVLYIALTLLALMIWRLG